MPARLAKIAMTATVALLPALAGIVLIYVSLRDGPA